MAAGRAIRLRSEPADFTNRDLKEVGEVIRANRFYCKSYEWNQEFCNEDGDFRGDFQDNFDGTVTDRATGLMWQKGHRPAYGRWADAQQYVRALNKERWCSYSDWRLPTIEELASIITRPRPNDGLHVAPVFSNRMWVWSCDVKDASSGFVWNGNFLYGSVYWIDTGNGQDVRAVRTAVIPPGRAFLQDQLAYVASGDVDGLLRNHYHEDAELVTFDGVVKGREALGRFFSETVGEKAGTILGVSLESFAESGDVILYKATVRTKKGGTVGGEDALYRKQGKVWRHIVMSRRGNETP